ncbi:MAG TPA: dihydrodipicolinate synthase family protein [Gemmatimonadaceae bacterium]|nr:dihydrodipicolinate synthase family protein [Gemmatimonadaceae bacterium]
MREHLLRGQVIPAHPLALDSRRTLDERHQRALTRYYVDAGAGGIAVGVHTTQFEIRDPRHGLYRPVLELAAEAAAERLANAPRPFVMVAGLAGDTSEAVAEADTARSVGYDIGLLSLGAWRGADEDSIVAHCRAVSDVIPLFGFYLQPAVGGRDLSYAFWRELAELPGLWAVKIAPFDRYRTIDVVRAMVSASREDVALYTGNDDSIVVDLLTPFPVESAGKTTARRIAGGLLGQWAVWTRHAVEMLDEIRAMREHSEEGNGRRGGGYGKSMDDWLGSAAVLTEANAAIFDAANGFAGCIAGIHEVLRRQGLMRGIWCLDPAQGLSPGQSEEIDRVVRLHPELTDDAWVAERLDDWLA